MRLPRLLGRSTPSLSMDATRAHWYIGYCGNYSSVRSESIPEDCRHGVLRLCHLRLDGGVDAKDYGFTLSTGSASGQFVGEVDHHSAAERAGLLSGDRLVEVNGVNVETDSHYEV